MGSSCLGGFCRLGASRHLCITTGPMNSFRYSSLRKGFSSSTYTSAFYTVGIDQERNVTDDIPFGG
jgi:hypothetical protein